MAQLKISQLFRTLVFCGVAALGSASVAWAGAANEKPAAATSEKPVATADKSAGVNINTADAQTLADGLDGIGLKKAEAIVAHRTQIGKFTSADQLLDVKGIGKATLDKNRDKIKI